MPTAASKSSRCAGKQSFNHQKDSAPEPVPGKISVFLGRGYAVNWRKLSQWEQNPGGWSV